MTHASMVTIAGDNSLGGTYILRMQITQDIHVQFGQFQRGASILIPSGEMFYLGSAMRGLASRVLRHALRTGEKPKHTLYESLFSKMENVGLINGRFRPPTQKKLHWHIDYLLDETAVSLSHAILIRSEKKLEYDIGEWVLAQPETAVLLPGLGASDVKGHTHLLRTTSNAAQFWQHLRICGIF